MLVNLREDEPSRTHSDTISLFAGESDRRCTYNIHIKYIYLDICELMQELCVGHIWFISKFVYNTTKLVQVNNYNYDFMNNFKILLEKQKQKDSFTYWR